MQPSLVNTIAQWALIALGFIAFFVELFSDRLQKGKTGHNAIRITKLVTALLVAAFGFIAYFTGNILQEQASAQLATMSEDLASAHEKIGMLEETAPKIDESGRIVAALGVSYASEYTAGISTARSLFTQGKLTEAFAEAERLSKKKSDFGLAYFIMGTVKAQQGAYAEAKRFLVKSIDLGLNNSDLAWAYHNLGIVALRQQDISVAKSNFEAALKADPKMNDSREMLTKLKFPTIESTRPQNRPSSSEQY